MDFVMTVHFYFEANDQDQATQIAALIAQAAKQINENVEADVQEVEVL